MSEQATVIRKSQQLFKSAVYIQMQSRLILSLNPDQTAPKGSLTWVHNVGPHLGPNCLTYQQTTMSLARKLGKLPVG